MAGKIPPRDNAAMENKGKYLNPFTDFGFKKLFGEEMAEYENSLKHYRDNKNTIDSAEMRGEHKKAIEIARRGLQKNMPLAEIADLTGLSEEEITALQE